MSILSWFDNRTLIACQCLLAIVFSAVFVGMQRSYPSMRGVRSIALSLLFGIPGTILLAGRGIVPESVSILAGNLCVLLSFLFLYRGILKLIKSRLTIQLPLAAAILAEAVLYFESQVHYNIVPRIIAMSLVIALIRGLISFELFRKARTSTNPNGTRFFAAFMAFFAAVSLNRGIMTLLHGSPQNYLENNLIQTSTLMLGIVFICLTALFFLVISTGELIAFSRDESHQDSVSGALNRRGIEAKLAIELKRINRTSQKLSIALMDIDYFKAINDNLGHAAGDAALRQIAETIAGRLRAYDYLGRFGGDEFLLILPQTPCADALIVTERLSHSVNGIVDSTRSRPLSLSIGLTEATATDDAITLLGRADKALYQAKTDGRNCRRVILPESASAAGPGASVDSILMSSNESGLSSQ
jgi:diguanylate cyclase (GGDEF)-like protein